MIPDASQRAKIVEIVRAAAQAEILPRFRRLGDGTVKEKTSDQDLVTVADTAAEAAIRAGIEAAFPQATVVGEESVSEDGSLLDLIAGAEMSVIIDPIDGTWNYAKGIGVFGVIIAVAHKGETVYGLLYDPLGDDWVWAAKGAGAWQSFPDRDDVRLQITPRTETREGLVPLYLFAKNRQAQVAAMFPDYERFMTLRCACHEYRALAADHVGFAMHAGLNAWDHAAGVLVHQEAGGHAALFDGQTYRPTLRTGTLILASSESHWAEIRALFDFLDGPETITA